MRDIDGISPTSQNRSRHGNDGAALGNRQGNCAAHWRIGSAGDSRGRVIGNGRSINRDRRGGSVDSTTVSGRASVARRISDLGSDGIRAFSQSLWHVHRISATSQNQSGHGDDGAALGDRQRDSATHRRIGGACNCRRGVVGDSRSIDSDSRSGSVDSTAVSGRASIAGGVGDFGIDRVWAFSQRLIKFDGVGAASQNRGRYGDDGAALGDRQRNSAAHRRIGRTGDGRSGVVGNCRCIDRDQWSGSVDSAAVSGRTCVAGGVGDRRINGVRAFSKP